ncbi:Pycsar system effector family protein [Streptomyces netropsis]|uniref:Pycsar system effector family protein n=1 Tax=Streptomyces netropsis TaxID=55404 RepID=UPI0037B9DC6D
MAALLRSALSDGPTIARVAVGLASGFLAVSLVFIVLACCPGSTVKDEGTSFPIWAEMSPQEVREAVQKGTRPHQVAILSRRARLKYRRFTATCIATSLGALLLLVANRLAALG